MDLIITQPRRFGGGERRNMNYKLLCWTSFTGQGCMEPLVPWIRYCQSTDGSLNSLTIVRFLGTFPPSIFPIFYTLFLGYTRY